MFIAEVPFLKVLEAARRGYRAHGIELNLWLVLYSRVKVAIARLRLAHWGSREQRLSPAKTSGSQT